MSFENGGAFTAETVEETAQGDGRVWLRRAIKGLTGSLGDKYTAGERIAFTEFSASGER